jgi:hypothetical protein
MIWLSVFDDLTIFKTTEKTFQKQKAKILFTSSKLLHQIQQNGDGH